MPRDLVVASKDYSITGVAKGSKILLERKKKYMKEPFLKIMVIMIFDFIEIFTKNMKNLIFRKKRYFLIIKSNISLFCTDVMKFK